MKYELAKKLKEAGFGEDKDVPDTQSSPSGKGDWLYGPKGVPNDEMVYVPTLSELIRACGERLAYIGPFRSLSDGGNEIVGWGCADFHDEEKKMVYDGSTPEEAVANLWLELNKKHEPKRK